MSAVAALASIAMLATACGGGSKDTGQGATTEAGGTISIWARDSQQGFMSQLVSLYNRTTRCRPR